jgi:hypothetical protein
LLDVSVVQTRVPDRSTKRAKLLPLVRRGRLLNAFVVQTLVQTRTPDRIARRTRYNFVQRRGRSWTTRLIGAVISQPVPDWFEGSPQSTGNEAASYTQSGDGTALGLGSEGSASTGDFEGTPH